MFLNLKACLKFIRQTLQDRSLYYVSSSTFRSYPKNVTRTMFDEQSFTHSLVFFLSLPSIKFIKRFLFRLLWNRDPIRFLSDVHFRRGGEFYEATFATILLPRQSFWFYLFHSSSFSLYNENGDLEVCVQTKFKTNARLLLNRLSHYKFNLLLSFRKLVSIIAFICSERQTLWFDASSRTVIWNRLINRHRPPVH